MVVSAKTPAPERPCFELEEDASSFLPLVRAVVGAVLKEPPHHPDVEDCAQDALRRAIEGRDRAESPQAMRPWVVGIARHVALDALRARQRQRQREAAPAPAESSPEPMLARIASSDPTALEQLERKARATALARALETLPEGMREAITLFHCEGKDYRAISRELGVPMGTVATWITRGRKLLASAVSREETQS